VEQELGRIFSYPRFAQYVRPSPSDLTDFGEFTEVEIDFDDCTDLIQRSTEPSDPTERAEILMALAAAEARDDSRRLEAKRLLIPATITLLAGALTNRDLASILFIARSIASRLAALFV